MKKYKKFLGLLMAALMVFTLTPLTALADQVTGNVKDAKGKIVIKSTVPDQTYSVYKILELESYSYDEDDQNNAEKQAYSYKPANDDWAVFLMDRNILNTYVEFVDGDYVKWIDGADPAEFAARAIEFVKRAPGVIKPTKEATASKGPQSGEGADVIFDDLDLGYYLVDSSVGTLCSLNTTDPEASITDKNDWPTNVKTVQEDSKKDEEGTHGFNRENDACIGDTINFKSVIAVPGKDTDEVQSAGAANYVFHDKMSDGLTFKNDVEVKKNGEPLTAKVDYTLSTPKEGETKLADGCTFEIVFTKDFCESLMGGDVIEIAYSAVLNESAKIGPEGNPNESKLSYGEDPSNQITTTPSETKTYTWKASVFKFAKNGETETPLAGAKFSLLNSDNSTIKFTKLAEKEGEIPSYRVDPNGDVEEIETTGDGRFSILGLDEGVYKLKETAAPGGYNKLSEDITVTVTSKLGYDTVTPTEKPRAEISYTLTANGKPVAAGDGAIKVQNNKGLQLPSTGGIGTTIFYVGGGILVIGAIVYLVTRRRAKSSK